MVTRDDLRYENRHLRAMVKLLQEQILAMQERREAEAEYDELLAGSRELDDSEYPASELQQLQGREIVTNV